jgi:LCP family protein required for cell wall assembly
VSDDERRDDQTPERPGDDVEGVEPEAPGGAEEAPEPSTWAGKQKWSGLPDDHEAGAGDEAAEHPIPADALADEGDEPSDEFEFAEETAEGEGGEAVAEGDEDEAAAGGDQEEPAEDDEGEGDGDEPEKEPDGKTVEADTLAMADSEEAREAALAGLKARTASHAAKRGVTDPGIKPEGASDADEGEAEDESVAQEEEPATAIAAASAPAAPAAAPASPDQEKPPRTGYWARFLAASFLIIASMAAATSISLLVYLTDIAKGLGGLDGVQNQLSEVEGGKPQNFLILGSDVRPGETGKGRSDTTMLLRIDNESDVISQLSIPRDLRVNIPGHGIDKFNAAYSYGGPKLTLQVVKQSILGPDVPINHVVNIDFNGFADAVDAIDCVDIDVDHHYFNDNASAVSFTEQYAEIDIEAGYQRLCGFKALQYVRYRHEDNDIVRAARQQTFLREARQKVPPSKLLDDRNELIDIFENYTTSDIDDVATLVQLFKLMLDARSAQINQIEFPFASLDEQGYVTKDVDELKAAVNEFLGVGVPEPEPAEPKEDDGGGDKPDKDKPKPDEEPDTDPIEQAAAAMIDSTTSGQDYAALIRDQADRLKFPVLYPSRILPPSAIDDDTRFFKIDGPGDDVYRGYKYVMSIPGTTYPTAYYGVSGTNWVDAPLFNNASEEREIGERNYRLYYDAGKLRMVAFERDGAMYWVTNTLDKILTEPQMLAIAQNLAVAGG